MSAQPHLTIPLEDIAAAQAANHVTAYDEDHALSEVLRLQSVYAAALEKREAMKRLFDVGFSSIVLGSGPESLYLHLGDAAAASLYPPIIDAFDEALSSLEAQIVQAHIRLARDRRETASSPRPTPDYAAAIRQLCTEAPAALPVAELASPTPVPTTPAPTRQVPQRTTTNSLDAGSNLSQGAAAAA